MVESLSDSSLAAGPKLHRLQLLRSWLLYFVTVVHGYFMSRVLATTELELRDQLTRARDLDQLIEVHQNYITRIYDRQVPVLSIHTYFVYFVYNKFDVLGHIYWVCPAGRALYGRPLLLFILAECWSGGEEQEGG